MSRKIDFSKRPFPDELPKFVIADVVEIFGGELLKEFRIGIRKLLEPCQHFVLRKSLCGRNTPLPYVAVFLLSSWGLACLPRSMQRRTRDMRIVRCARIVFDIGTGG